MHRPPLITSQKLGQSDLVYWVYRSSWLYNSSCPVNGDAVHGSWFVLQKSVLPTLQQR